MYAENSPEAVEISDVKNSPTAIIGESDTHTRIQVNYISGVMPSCFPYTNGGAGCVNSTIKPFSINSYSGIKGQAGSVAGLMDVTYLRNPNASGYISIILFPPQQNSTTAQDIYNSILSNFKFTQ
jgi:hypothetical protein